MDPRTESVEDSDPYPTAGTRPELSRTARLDRLPFTREHSRLLVGAGIGWALDAMDVGLISFVMVALAQQWMLDATTLSWIASIGFVGMAIGASVGGLLADRIGRRQVFAGTLLVYGLATGASALAGGVAVLMLLRFLVGLGLGAELPVASTLVSEYSPTAVRGRVVVALESFWAVGWVLAALVGYLLVPSSPDGWRWALAVGLIPAGYALVVRFGLPESVRFLERTGRGAQAEAAVQRFESSAGLAQSETAPSGPEPTGPAALIPEPTKATTDTPTTSLARLWAPPLRRRTAALWTVWFTVNLSYYGAFIWLPTLIAAHGYSIVKSLQYTLIITLAQLPGYAMSAYLIERWGRRATLASFLAGSAFAAFTFGVVRGDTLLLAAGMALSYFNLGAWGALYAVTPEIYPTSIRGTGAGAAAGFGRLASIIAPLIVPVVIGWGGSLLVFALFAAAFAVAAVVATGLPEQTGRDLED